MLGDIEIEQEVIWAPQPGKQHALVECPVYEIFYGGARGGGKTDGVIGKMGHCAQTYGMHFNCLFFRKELHGLDDSIERSRQIYRPFGTYADYKKTWTFHSGGRLRFRPLESVADVEKYQGQNISHIVVEEIGNYADQSIIQKLHGLLRSAAGVNTQIIFTGNPAGAGQAWLKERFVDPYPLGMKILRQEFADGEYRERVFIPAKVWDNQILLQNDPRYITNLKMVGSEALVKAWLEGSWDAVEGAFFDKFSIVKHVLKPFTIPSHWYKIRAFDWGYAKPFCVLWGAVSDGKPFVNHLGEEQILPVNAIVIYREFYGSVSADVGVRMDNSEIAKQTVKMEIAENIDDMVADPAIWISNGGISIGEELLANGCFYRKADNKRLAGWQQIRERLGSEEPLLYIFSTCTNLLRTIPIMQHDHKTPEDLDTTSEDHAVDTLRYLCMSRPLTKTLAQNKEQWDINVYLKEQAEKLQKHNPNKGGRYGL